MSVRRILAVDYGLKRIGVAITDPLGSAAQPLPVVENTGDDAAIDILVELIKSREVELCLVGLPLNMDGTEGPMAAKIRAFVAKLEPRLPEVEFSVRDERLTSWSAEQEEFAKGRKPWKDKGRIDTRAAMLLLEDYLAGEDPSRALLPENAPLPPSLLKPGRQKSGRDRGRGRGSRKGSRGRR